jgi:ATP-dependent exoDNAse (exonuclease V) beta subunit
MPSLHLVPKPVPNSVPDADARAQALDITQSFLVEAPAGSGKTALLIQRFLKLLASETVEDPSQVLAITFTRKATSEMLERVLAQLTAAQTPSTPPQIEADSGRQHAGAPSQMALSFEVGFDEPRNERLSDFDRATRALAEAVLARDRQLGWGLLDHPHRLNIRTIDSISNEIANALPILAGSGGAQSPTDDATALHAEAARRTLMLLGGSDPSLNAALELILLHRDGNLADCEELIAAMLAIRDQWGELVPLSLPELDEHFLDQTVLPRLDRTLDLAICRILTNVSEAIPPDLLTSLCDLAVEMRHAPGSGGHPSPLAHCSESTMPPEPKSAHLPQWRALVDLLLTKEGNFRAPKGVHRGNLKFEIEPHHVQRLKDIIATVNHDESLCAVLHTLRGVPPGRYPRDQWPVTKALFRVLARALAELQLVFAERSQCDFAEVGLLARTALRSDSSLSGLAEASGHRLQHLLVDEMQDTSSGQYEFIQLLTRHWDGSSQTVFLVGDPKQSIYLFRQARVERFVRTLQSARLGDLPLTVLRLTANFRSQPALVDAFNADFTKIFATFPGAPSQTAPSFEVVGSHHADITYHPASATRTGQGSRHWHPTIIPYASDPTAVIDQRILHARQIREIVTQWRAKPLPDGRTEPWKIAVLVRNRSHLEHIVPALKQSPAIPYRAIDIEPLAERPEILDLLALTRALLHPADRTAWLALLRSPVCGLSLADLHRLASEDRETAVVELIRTRGADLSADGMARLEPFWSVIAEALTLRGQMPIAEWVAHTWRVFGIPAFTAPEALANAETFFQLLDEMEQSGPALDLTRLGRKMQRLYAATSAAPDAVDLTTLHNAKGLEWDVVLVPELHRQTQGNTSKLLNWLETSPDDLADNDEIAAGILAPIAGKGRATHQLNAWMRSIENAREAAERKRLFYVACTRAREELHLFAAPEARKDGSIAPRSDSLLSAAWPAAETVFAAPTATVIAMPQPRILNTIAASTPTPRLIQRIPTPYSILPIPCLRPTHTFTRPEGSFAARALGNATHAFLELLAKQIAAGTAPEITRWQPRIAAVLRAAGLAPSEIPSQSSAVLRALANTLDSPEGRWILAPHPGSGAEASIASEQATIRLDRTFLAGPTPLSTGDTHLWIVDYKTATHGPQNLATFLAAEREKYAPQLEAYARSLTAAFPIRLALFYPMLPHLIWWEPAYDR